MWLLIFLSVLFSAIVIEGASDDIVNEATVFRKCCPRNQSLVKVMENGTAFNDRYHCMDRNSLEKKYNVLYLPLLISYNITLEYGLPAECDELQVIQGTEVEVEIKTSDNQCYDRLVMEIINGTLKQNIPKTVMLSCIRKDIENVSTSMLKIYNIRKCCPNGKNYDLEYHLCRNTEDRNEEEWLTKWLKVEGFINYIYETKNGLQCKSDQFAVELKEEMFVLRVEEGILNALGKNGERIGPVPKGEWCMDRLYDGSGLVARACTRDCSAAGAFCMRKCCPVGEHYRPRRCGSPISVCVKNRDEGVLYNISSYLDPLQRKYDNLTDVLGIRSDLRCPAGKYVLNNTSERDHHQLTQEGLLESPNGVGQDYCIEAFDRRHCYGDVVVTAIVCFVEIPESKDFFVSFLLNSISSICLALTLVVYCALPELRNLHGRTLICHVSMMLLAYSCLARVQYGKVPDKRICTMLGYGIYFGFVAAFAWLNVMCLDIWWTFGSVRSVQPLRKAGADRRRFAWYSLYAWSVAVLLTLTMLMLDLYPVASSLDANIGNGICWFASVQNAQTDWPHYIFFVVPMGLVTCTNFVLWVLTARHCARVKSEVHRLQAGSVGDRAKRTFRMDRAKYVLTGKLWVVMGAGWISELLSTLASEPKWFWTIIDLFNELQGVFIFFILVFKPKLYYLIRKRLGMEKPEAQKNGTSSTARTSSTFLSRTVSTDERTNLKIALPNK